MIFPVERLIAAQFPQWAHLPVTPVEPGGWDNRTFRLGGTMTVRMLSSPGHAGQAEKEQRWLPVLAPQLPLPVPVPLAAGVPGEGYPYGWSVYPWIDGSPASLDGITDLVAFAETLADFLEALAAVDPTGGPPPAAHGGFRGAPLTTYDDETRRTVAALGDRIDGRAALRVWDEALAAPFAGPPVWFHGDVAAGNLLVRGGRLAAVIDFGCTGVGDPACDLAIAWTLLHGESRRVFRAALGVDDGMWARGRGWVLWKELITQLGRLEAP